MINYGSVFITKFYSADQFKRDGGGRAELVEVMGEGRDRKVIGAHT
jgi:hypothetical protein